MYIFNKDLVKKFNNNPLNFIDKDGVCEVPFGVKNIKDYAFHHCKHIRNVKIPKTVVSIGRGAFRNCDNLETIYIPKNVKNIEQSAFGYCRRLENAILPKGLTTIPPNMFYACTRLKNITIPDSVTSIGEYSFWNCHDLDKIIIPENVTSIGQSAFSACISLQSIIIPDNVISVEEYAFNQCKNIQSILIGKNVKILKKNVFNDCENLKQLNICGNQINLSDITPINLFGNDQIREYFYANKYAKQLKPFIDKRINIPLQIIENLIADDIIDVDKPFNCKHIINELNCIFKNDENLQQEFQKSTTEEQIDFYKLATKLGVFSSDSKVAQKASSAIVSLLKDKVFAMADFHKYFDTVKANKTNVKIVDFLNSKNINLPEIIQLENSYPKILSKIINSYDSFLECKTIIDDNGKPKKISFKDAAIKLYTETKYDNVTPDNKNIAFEFAKFSIQQEYFDQAIELKQESDKQTNILQEDFNEASLFEQIENIKNDTENKIVSAQTLAKEFLEKKFTYEILNKQDPRNLILGAYCSCCANINSHYYGKKIAISSFTSSNVDNIVVKNTEGNIIAKGTIYVNRKNGYGVINDFELNDKYKKDGYKTDDKQLIFNTFKRAVGSFVNKYNEKNEKPITKVNVGLGYNRLAEYTKELDKEKKLLSVPEKFGFHDASKDQYIIYKAQEKLEKSQ